ncbi:hypothetical protein LP421_14320 [Rhizobium sp. RCAM05350]|nr:hypothetical protein LP421_14320 [Rhizobium sp. RCAM05350]
MPSRLRGYEMLFKTATSRNIFSVVATGLFATVVTAGTLFWISYSEVKRRSVDEMNAAAALTAADLKSQLTQGLQLVATFQSVFRRSKHLEPQPEPPLMP